MWIALILITAVIIWLSTNKRYRWIYIIFKTLPRDIKVARVYYKIYQLSNTIYKEKKSLVGVFDALVKQDSQKIALYFQEEKWTYDRVDKLSNKITRHFKKEGLTKGDTVALLMENCPEYPCVILGLSRIGVITALINTNLVKDSLLHSITVINPKGVIVGNSCKESLREVSSNLEYTKLFQLNRLLEKDPVPAGWINLSEQLNAVSDKTIEHVDYKADPKDSIIYIYTSGTTGLPKASVLTQLRYILGAETFALVVGLKQDDVVYTPLPLYHTAGGMLGLGQALVMGVPVVLKKKFSATNYFEDCVKYNVTIAQYIGEMCRYILSTSQHKLQHKVRAMVGNGLKPQIWKTFVTKFGIENLIEVYGATEGISNFVNIDNKIGSIGCIPWLLRRHFPVTLIKCDEEGNPIRDTFGHCVECSVNEAGVAVGKIDRSKAVLRFDGYTDKAASEKKILRNVFKEGDEYFNSGDILTSDELGYFYFKDRIGDTFRWKGENISTSEVEAVISNLVQLADVIVYGVEVPHTEGRAGMAAIMDPNSTVDIDQLGLDLKSHLPNYAIPIFIRILDLIPLTGTFKLKKVELRNEGFDANIITDKMYIFDAKLGNYVNFTMSLNDKVKSGKLRL